MKSTHKTPRSSAIIGALTILAIATMGCAGEDGSGGDNTVDLGDQIILSDGDGDGDGGDTDVVQQAASWDNVRPIIEQRCARCHAADRLSTYRRLETHIEVTALRERILDKIGSAPVRGQRMPLASNHVGAGGCVPDHEEINDKRLTDTERDLLIEYLQRDDHLDYVDTYEPIVAPEVTPLPGAIEYTSSQFDVVNDGFLPHPDGDLAEYMEEFGYDERDFDQMEDDFICIIFDPMRGTPSVITGLQVTMGIGQIYLNSQLVIDTNGGSATARAAAGERGNDWYRCDDGLGFEGHIPLFRTVPGGDSIVMPAQTGLSFEPSWRFVLRIDQHTHFDAVEFNRLNQNGEIDMEARTMTWFNQVSLRVQWGSPEDVTRALEYIRIGPLTEAEEADFLVARGESTLTYSASIPGDATKTYHIFSAELSMGKYGDTVSLQSNDDEVCIANNSDFAPKWIEQSIFAETNAPRIDSNTTLNLRCAYRNNSSEALTYGVESEATVYGLKERCEAVVFYYEAP